MQVDNWTQDVMGSTNLYGRLPLKRIPGTISKRAYARLIREAKRFFDGHDIDFTRYEEPVLTFDDMIACDLVWKHKKSGCELRLSAVWFEKRTGEINQAGSNYGALTI